MGHGSPSDDHTWLDREFWNQGAFLSAFDGESVLFAKGGSFSFAETFPTSGEIFFALKDFYISRFLIYRPREILRLKKNEAIALVEALPHETASYQRIGALEDVYERDFARLKKVFSDELKKVVLVSRESYESFEGDKTVKHLFQKAFSFGTGQPYGLWNPHFGVVGSTPELLFSKKELKLKTFALAGTAKAGQEDELMKSAKDRFEHELVVKDIAEKLVSLKAQVSVKETGTWPYRKIVHLKTDIEAELSPETSAYDLAVKLSPTAALGGYPQEEALKFLSQTEYAKKNPGRIFGSCQGAVTRETTEFVVCIRNVQWNEKELFIESGGGVVPESVLEKEIEEIHLKRQVIRDHYL